MQRISVSKWWYSNNTGNNALRGTHHDKIWRFVNHHFIQQLHRSVRCMLGSYRHLNSYLPAPVHSILIVHKHSVRFSTYYICHLSGTLWSIRILPPVNEHETDILHYCSLDFKIVLHKLLLSLVCLIRQCPKRLQWSRRRHLIHFTASENIKWFHQTWEVSTIIL